LQSSDTVQGFDNSIKETFANSNASASSATTATAETGPVSYGKSNSSKAFRSADLSSARTVTALARHFDTTKTSKQSLEMLLLGSDGEVIKRKFYSGGSLTQLMETWNNAQKFSSTKFTRVAMFDVDLPDEVSVGGVSLKDIDKSVESMRHDALVEGLEFAGLAISAGMVAWVARVGGLVAALITALPAWKSLDPLLMLATEQDRIDRSGAEFSDTDIRMDEEAVEAVIF
jgi:hypothetical protein